MAWNWKHDVVVEVTLKTTDEGGRKGPTLTNHFGCPVKYGDKYFDLFFDLTRTGSMVPGGTVRVPAQFMCPELVKKDLSVGSKLVLHEGREIGHAMVVEIL
jgi:hypothetical protein